MRIGSMSLSPSQLMVGSNNRQTCFYQRTMLAITVQSQRTPQTLQALAHAPQAVVAGTAGSVRRQATAVVADAHNDGVRHHLHTHLDMAGMGMFFHIGQSLLSHAPQGFRHGRPQSIGPFCNLAAYL